MTIANNDNPAHSGVTGNLKWCISGDTLAISGTGEMPDYDSWYNKPPWYSYSSGITHADIATGVTSIGNCAFSGCEDLTSATIPNSVTVIGLGAFANCSGLTSVGIPDSVTAIGHYAFVGCSGLTSVTIPNSVTSIGNSAFPRCTDLISIAADEGNISYSQGIDFKTMSSFVGFIASITMFAVWIFSEKKWLQGIGSLLSVISFSASLIPKNERISS